MNLYFNNSNEWLNNDNPIGRGAGRVFYFINILNPIINSIMALASSGQLTLGEIQTEFGGSAPTALSEYYSGGSNVPAGTQSGGGVTIPTSCLLYTSPSPRDRW